MVVFFQCVYDLALVCLSIFDLKLGYVFIHFYLGQEDIIFVSINVSIYSSIYVIITLREIAKGFKMKIH